MLSINNLGGSQAIKPARANEMWLQEASRTKLVDFSFNVITVDPTGTAADKSEGHAQHYLESLDRQIKLDMVQVQGGTFLMGTSYAETERVAIEYKRYMGDDERLNHYGDQCVAMELPQHRVAVPDFLMGKFEVTQAQWRAVAKMPKVKRDLLSDPSFFKGDDLPAEEVTWEDAIEFCDRLSRATGKDYRLPSEAEWEYACRGGTRTQFHFGDTITSELVNFAGRYRYGSAPTGPDRGKTIPVGDLAAANAFGLFDMHGNIREWCMDPWHGNYNGAPSDGSVWMKNGDPNYHVVRGGSWLEIPSYSRSASRAMLWWTRNKNYYTGLRVACSIP